MRGPLAGFHIIEVAALGAAPFGCMLLADLGATVVRIERPGQNVATRPMEPILRNRYRSIILDLKQGAAIDVLLRLVSSTDCLVEGFRPGVAERLGFGPDLCMSRNPRLIYARMTGWGQDGPLANAAGHDLNYIALSGLLHQVGIKGGKPVPPLNVVGDYGGGGLLLSFGILAAVVERSQSGLGQVVDASMLDGAVALLAETFGLMARGSWRDGPGENFLSGAAHYYDTYETKDGKFVAVAAIEPQFYKVLIRKLGLDQERFQSAAGFTPSRYDRLVDEIWPPLKQECAAVFATKTRAEWCAIFEGSDGCFTPVLSLEEMHAHPHIVARGTVMSLDGVQQNAPAPRFSRTPAAVPSSPRIPGENTDEILKELNYCEKDIEAMKSVGAVR